MKSATIAAVPETDFTVATLEKTVFDASPKSPPITGIKFPLAKRAVRSAKVSFPAAKIVWKLSKRFIVEKRKTISVVKVLRTKFQIERRSTLDGNAPPIIAANDSLYNEKKNELPIP